MPLVGGSRLGNNGVITVEPLDSQAIVEPVVTPTAVVSTVVNTVSGRNLGSGIGLFSASSGTNKVMLDFKTLVAGSGVTLTETSRSITLTATGGGGGGASEFTDLTDAPGTIVNKGILVGGSGSLTFISAPTTSDTFLKWNGTSFSWVAGANGTVTSINASGSNGITVTGGPITTNGTLGLSLSTTGVAAATYIAPTITVDAYGRITSATSNALGEVNTVTNLGLGAPLYSSKSGSALRFRSLTASGPISISSTSDEINISANAVTSVALSGTNGITTSGGPITSSGTIAVSLGATGVTAGAYTAGNITVDAYGRITAAANGNVGVTSIAATGTNGISVSGGPITSTGTLTIALASTTVVAGTYTAPTLVIDAQGRITSAVGNAVVLTASNLGSGTGNIGRLFAGKVGTDLTFRRFVGSGGLVITETTNDVTIDGSGITGTSVGVYNNASLLSSAISGLDISGTKLGVSVNGSIATITTSAVSAAEVPPVTYDWRGTGSETLSAATLALYNSLNSAINPFSILTFTHNLATVVETGTSLATATLSWTYAGSRNPTSQTITGPGSPGSQAVANRSVSLTGLSITSNATWTLTTVDTGKTYTSTVSAVFGYKLYYGRSTVTTLTETTAEALSNNVTSTTRVGTYAFIADINNTYLWLAYPNAWHSGFDVNSSVVDAATNLPVPMYDAGTISVTNTLGSVATYRLIRSLNGISGALTIKVI